MDYSFVSHATVMMPCFALLEMLMLAGSFATVRFEHETLRPRRKGEAFAVAQDRWNGTFAYHGFFLWMLSAFGSYYVLYG
jgi:hypothetical protein